MGGADLNRQEIDLSSLRKLQAWFGEDGELEESEFVEAFGSILGSNLTKEQLTHLFMKIDANSDGSVDWDEFTNYMFLGNADARDVSTAITAGFNSYYLQIGDTVFDSNNTARELHREPIVRIDLIEKTQQLVTVGRDAVVKLWDPLNLLHHATMKLSVFQDKGRRAMDQVTASTYLQSANVLAVATIGNGVSFFDILSDTRKRAAHISAQDLGYATAISLHVSADKAKKYEAFHIGCDDGRVHCFPSVERLLTSGDTAHGEFPVHSDHVTCVEFISDLSAVVSASLDTTIKVVSVETGQVKRVFSGHKKAVYDFAWCPSVKAIASCGVERRVLLWSPYSQRTIAVLLGHVSSVKKVAFSVENEELISLAQDNTIKVWDLRSHRCLQTFDPPAESTAHARNGRTGKFRSRIMDSSMGISTLAVVRNVPCFYTGGSKLKLWPLKRLVCTHEAAYRPPIVGVLYNSSFDQVVTADEDAYVSVWSLKDGSMISKFRAAGSVAIKDNQEQNQADMDISGCNTYELNLPLRKVQNRVRCDTHESRHSESFQRDSRQSEGVSFESIAENLQPSREMQGLEPNITCLCFDAGGRRLITGSSSGDCLKIWNFSNGCLLQELAKDVKADPEDSDESGAEEAPPLKASLANAKAGTKSPSQNKANVARETTGVIYMQQSASGGDSKFVVSVGWDRLAYIWADGVDPAAKTIGFCKTLGAYEPTIPDERASGRYQHSYRGRVKSNVGHSSDILCVTHIPPSMIATGGSDGFVFVWNVNTGGVLLKLGVGERVEGLVYLAKRDILVTSKPDGVADLISVRHRMVVDSVRVSFDTSEPIAAVCTDYENEVLITADQKSQVKVWEMNDTLTMGLLAMWSAGESVLTAMEYVETRTVLETFVIIGQYNGIVSTWTLSGEKVGTFGQSDNWDLASVVVNTDSFVRAGEVDYSVSMSLSAEDQRQRQKIRETCAKEKIKSAQQGGGPQVGEVWSSVDCVGKLVALLTITESKEGEITSIDGTGQERKMPVEKVTSGDPLFRKDSTLSLYIGRVIEQRFKVLYLTLHDGACRIVDTQLKEHPMPTMAASGFAFSLSISAMKEFQKHNLEKGGYTFPSLTLTEAFNPAEVEIAPKQLEVDQEIERLVTSPEPAMEKEKDGFIPRPPEKPASSAVSKRYSVSIHRLLKKRMFAKTESGKSLLAHRRRIHKVEDLPIDFKQLRANLSVRRANSSRSHLT